jgi:hypothetical protein
MKNIHIVEKQILRLYHNNIDVEEIVQLMRSRDISAEFVKSVYNELSAKTKKIITDRFYYHSIEVGTNNDFDVVSCWTSRYLRAFRNRSTDSAFHEIKMFDLFNNKSM